MSAEERCAGVLAHVVDASHLVHGEQLSIMIDGAVRAVGMTAEVLLVDLAQQMLTPVQSGPVYCASGWAAATAHVRHRGRGGPTS